MNNLELHIIAFIIYLLSFVFLLFCQPHKKVTKKVTTGHSMRFSVFSIVLLAQTRMLHTPVDGHPLMPLCRNNLISLKLDQFIQPLRQKLAMRAGCPRIVRNTVCTALVSPPNGGCEKDRLYFLSVEGFFFLFGRCQKENKKISNIELRILQIETLSIN